MPQVPDFIMAELPKTVGRIEITRYFGISGTTIMLYDWLLTLGTEVELVWFSQRRAVAPSLLFILNRYLPIPIVLLSIYTSNPLRQNPLTDRFCSVGSAITVVGWVLNQASTTWLLSLRVISLYSGKKPVVWSVYIAYFVTHSTAVVLGIVALSSITSTTAYYTPINICAMSALNLSAGIPYFFPLAFELYILTLQILHHYCRNRSRRQNNLPSFGLLKTLYIDGYLYFVSCMLLRVLTVLMWQVSTGGLVYPSNQFEFAATVALASRFYLHLRKAVQKHVTGMTTDQYTCFSHGDVQFAPPAAGTSTSLEDLVPQNNLATVSISSTGVGSILPFDSTSGYKTTAISRLNSEFDDATYLSPQIPNQGKSDRVGTTVGVEMVPLKQVRRTEVQPDGL